MLCSILSAGSTGHDGIHLLSQDSRGLKAGVCKSKTNSGYMRSCLKTNKNRKDVGISRLPFLCCDHTQGLVPKRQCWSPGCVQGILVALGPSWEVVNTVGRGSADQSDGTAAWLAASAPETSAGTGKLSVLSLRDWVLLLAASAF